MSKRNQDTPFREYEGRDKEDLIEDIEAQGMLLDDKHYYQSEEIEKEFQSLFGKDVTPLLVERLKRILNNLMSVAIVVLPVTLFSIRAISLVR